MVRRTGRDQALRSASRAYLERTDTMESYTFSGASPRPQFDAKGCQRIHIRAPAMTRALGKIMGQTTIN
jgi:hypothetical protein